MPDTTFAEPLPWIQTYSGRMFWPAKPEASAVDLGDIAHSLSFMCRYGGHCRRFYSVAEHSVIVCDFLRREHPDRPDLHTWGLLHDASEAYLADIQKPTKVLLPDYTALEARVQRAVCAAFGLDPVEPPEVKEADIRILVDELRDLMASPPADWGLPLPPMGVKIEGWQPDEAKQTFLHRAHSLGIK